MKRLPVLMLIIFGMFVAHLQAADFEEVSVSGPAFSADVPFSTLYYQGETYDIVYASGGYNGAGFQGMLIVQNRADGSYWIGPVEIVPQVNHVHFLIIAEYTGIPD